MKSFEEKNVFPQRMKYISLNFFQNKKARRNLKKLVFQTDKQFGHTSFYVF
jgi:hypothetical protein